jgi:hypothetical protein
MNLPIGSEIHNIYFYVDDEKERWHEKLIQIQLSFS